VESPVNNPASQEELIGMALKLRKDLFNYEDKLGSCRDFTELMCSASALIVAILEPVEFRLSGCPTKKTAQMYTFPLKKQTIPVSLH
jgi:hypothetical protein